MSIDQAFTNPYLLLTPGPLSTTSRVRTAMLRDWCTWDRDYLELTQDIRSRLVRLATRKAPDLYTCALMQGSGTFCVEATIGSVIPRSSELLVLSNGAYGQRIAEIASLQSVPFTQIDYGDFRPIDCVELDSILTREKELTHVAFVHCETTTGMLNPLREAAEVVKRHGRTLIVDAMSSFGGIPVDVAELGVDFLISSANKCIQGVPGFGFVIARTEALLDSEGNSRSLALDLFDQWSAMEQGEGKWRFTSPTHTVHAFHEALLELEEEGGIEARARRYQRNQELLVEGMRAQGLLPLLRRDLQSPIITAFHYPLSKEFSFDRFYDDLKRKGFVIYPGKVTRYDTFRVGTIGDVHAAEIEELLDAVAEVRTWKVSSGEERCAV